MSVECPQTVACPLGAIHVKIIESLAKIELSVAFIPGLVKRIDDLESTRDLQQGWADSRKSTKKSLTRLTIAFIGFALTIMGFGVAIWATTHRTTDALQVSVESVRGEAADASDRASAVEGRLSIADEKAEAGAIARANLAARLKAMHAKVAKNSVDIAALPASAAPTKHWYQH